MESDNKNNGRTQHGSIFDLIFNKDGKVQQVNNKSSIAEDSDSYTDIIPVQDSVAEQASYINTEETGKSEEGYAVYNKRRASGRRRRKYYGDEESESGKSALMKKIDKINFVMNSEGCFINGKLFDPKDPPYGVAIVVDQKSAKSKEKQKQE